MKIKEVILLLVITKLAKCEHGHTEAKNSKNPLPYFRRYAEGVSEDSTIENPQLDPLTEDSTSNLVSVLVKNAKEIFDDPIDGNEVVELTTDRLSPDDDYTLVKSIPIEDTFVRTHDVMLYKNTSLDTLLDRNLIESPSDEEYIENTQIGELVNVTTPLESYEKPDLTTEYVPVLISLDSSVETTTQDSAIDPNGLKQCIFCNNILTDDCNVPQNTLLPTVVCDHYGDVCYSQHTPFGVIDRGCFNVNHNQTTYVCSCDLCNYISISEMPYIFPNKQDWIDNVIELSRNISFIKSVSKDMSCLRCEVNTTESKTADMFDSEQCLQGNIEYIPTQNCTENEVCAVKAVRREGYIWRGCVQTPLYNYWWALCDTELCNLENLFSIYDFVKYRIVILLGTCLEHCRPPYRRVRRLPTEVPMYFLLHENGRVIYKDRWRCASYLFSDQQA